MRGSAPGGSSQAAAARRCGTIGASWRFRGVAPGALATVGAAEAPILEWRRAVLKRVAPHTVSGATRISRPQLNELQLCLALVAASGQLRVLSVAVPLQSGQGRVIHVSYFPKYVLVCGDA